MWEGRRGLYFTRLLYFGSGAIGYPPPLLPGRRWNLSRAYSVGNVSFVVHVFANYLHVRPVYFHEQSIFTNNEYNLYTRLRSTISRSS